MPELDKLDKQIIYELAGNCRQSYQELAKKTGITANAVRKRIDKLESSGAIDYYTIEYTYTMIDAHSLMAWITTDGTSDEEEFSNQIGNLKFFLDVTPLTGGYYAAFADYITAEDMSDITRFVRSQECVLNVEIHPLVVYTSRPPPKPELELKKLHYRVLKPLIENPRMQINEIAQEINLTARKVRRAISEIMEHGGVRFTLKWNPEVSKGTHFVARIKYDESRTSQEEFTSLLLKKYPVLLWELFVSTIEPLIVAYFVVPTMEHVEQVTREIRQSGVVDSVISHVATKTRSYPGLRNRRLLEKIESENA
ncbi:MAG: winged helix-turn-helix transcriptional regulator [Candidatus Thorarchaeota archaeon]